MQSNHISNKDNQQDLCLANPSNDIPEDFHSPFKLQVIIHRAENLPIADYTTSDPYVLIALGERIEGRTKVIYRNHRAPVWEETFQIKLLQRNSVLKLKVFDHDVGKDDDLLGITAIDLLDIPLDKSVQKKYYVSGVGGYNCKSSRLDISLLIRSNESVIKIVPDRDIIDITDEVDEKVAEVLNIMEEESLAFKPTESMVKALKKVLARDNKVQYLSEELIHDILIDVTSLTTISSSDISPVNNNIFNRTSLRITNASKTIFDSRECHRHPPIGKNMIQINLHENDSKYVLLRFNNRFSSWVGTRWFQFLFDVWTGKIKTKGSFVSEIPYWASNRSYSFMSTLTLSDGKSFTGRCVIKFDVPFELKIQEETISLLGMYSFVMASDSLLPKAYILSMEVLSFSMTGEYSAEIQNKLQETGNDTPSITGFGVRRNFKRFGKSLVAGVLKGGKDATKFTASSIASGPLNMISTAHDGIVSVGKGIKTTVKNAPTTFLKSDTEFYLIFKSDGFTQKIFPNELFYLDLNEDSFNEKVAALSLHRRSSVNDNEVRKLAFTASLSNTSISSILPESITLKENISVALCKGKDVSHIVVGYTSLTTSQLENNLDKTCQIPLNSELGYSVTLLQSTGLPKLDRMLTSGNMYCKIRFVDHEGKASTIRQQEVKTSAVEPSSNPNWKEFNTILRIQDHFELINYIRIDVIIDDYSTKITVGNVYIPLRYFSLKPKEFTFPLTSLREKGVNSLVFKSSSINCLGEMTVKIQRIEESAEKLSTMVLRPTLVESNIFNTRWFTECVVSGLVDSDTLKEVETFSIMPSLECLELILDPSFNNHDISGRASAEPLQTLLANQSQKAKHNLEVEIVVFENQRRQYYFPFDWAKEAYTRPDFSDLSYATEYYFNANLIRTASPPEGFTWVQDSDWIIDKTYRNTDDQGWCYGHSFSKILSDYNAGKTITKPHSMQSRRRKWNRKAIANSTFDVYGPITMQALNNFAYANKRPHDSSSNKSQHFKIAGEKASLIKPIVDTGAIDEVTMHEILNHPINLWRYDMLLKYPNAVVSSCQERATFNGKVIIPWDQILNTTVLTPSILTISVQVHRFFADTVKNKCFYRSADIEMFVSNCPAAELKSLIDERKWFSKFKVKIREIVSSGNSLGIDLARISFGSNVSKADDDDGTNQKDDSKDVDADEGPPETEELSLGSILIADLDEYSIALDKQVKKLDEYLAQHYDAKVVLEKSIIVRRECRLRLYMAALFGVGLMGSHNFEEASIRAIMQKDFNRSLLIKHESDVQTANNRIEYFLDTAEKRIRDAVLCGWNYRGGQLEKCLEKFANGYFVEIVGLMGSFFEGGGSVTEVKGLGSKVELITTYLKHNDRLAVIIDHALRPYELHAEPAAVLSIFLDFDILVSWYTSVLLIEMHSRVDATLAVYKDISKDVTGRAKEYNFPVPWIPERANMNAGYFYTKIPDDLVELLQNYVQFARMSKENVAQSFHKNIGRMDAEVCLAYTSSFQYLSEQIQIELDSKSWADASSEDELSEYSTWLCSVANDAVRIEKYELYVPLLGTKHKEDNSRSSATLQAFQALNISALDHLSCILYTYLFHERKDAFQDGKLYMMWSDMYSTQNDDGTTSDLIAGLLEDMTFFVEEQMSFLERISYWKLLRIMTDKMITLYLYGLRMAYDASAFFGEKEFHHLTSDIESMKKVFNELLESTGHSDEIDISSSKGGSVVLDGPDVFETFKSNIKDKFIILEYSYELFSNELGSPELFKILEKLSILAKNNPKDANSIASLTETCLSLKGIKRNKAVDSKARTLSPPPQVIKATQRRSFWSSSSHSSPPSPPPVSSPMAENIDSNDSSSCIIIDEEEEHMKQLKEQSIIDCVKVQIQTIRCYGTTVDCDISSLPLNILNPVSRVFGAASRTDTPSLKTLLFHSFLPMKDASPNVVVNNDKKSSNGGWGFSSAFTGLFGSSSSSSVQNKRDKKKKDNAFTNEPHQKNDIHINKEHITSEIHETKIETPAHGSYMILTNLKVENLFHLDTIRSPHPYLTIQSGTFSFSTEPLSLTEGNSADWSDIEPIKIAINDEHAKHNTKSMEELIISLSYKGYINDQIVGSIKIQFASYSPPVFHSKTFVITDFSKSNTAKDAAQRAKDSGRQLPIITLSISSFIF